MPALSTEMVDSRSRFWARVSVIAWYLGLAALYLPVRFETLGGVLIIAALLAGVLMAPPEYALGAMAGAFLAASCSGLWVSFQTLRWIFLGMGAVMFSVRFVPRPGTPGPPRPPSAFSALMVFFLVASAATVLTSVARELTVLKLAAFVFLLYVGLRGAGPLVSMYGPAGPRRLAQGLLVYPMALVALSLLVQILQFRSLTGPGGRLADSLGNPNFWGILVVAILPWMVPPLFRRFREHRFRQAALALLVLLIGYTLVLTISRAALLGAVFALAIFCLVHADRRIAALALLGTMLVTAQSLADPDMWQHLANRYFYKYQQKRIGQFPGELQPFQSRLTAWKRAQANFQENPWLGLGFGVTSKAEASWSADIRSGSGALETGSSFWSSLGQVGLLGSVPLFLAVLILVFQAGQFALKVKDPWFTGIYASLVALAVNAAFEGWLLAPGNFIASYFWIQCFLANAMLTRFRPAAIRGRADYFPNKLGTLAKRPGEAVAGPAALG